MDSRPLVRRPQQKPIETDEGWSPYLSLEDAYKLDDVRESLKRGDLQSAAKLGRIFRLKPAAIPSRGKNKSLSVQNKYPVTP